MTTSHIQSLTIFKAVVVYLWLLRLRLIAGEIVEWFHHFQLLVLCPPSKFDVGTLASFPMQNLAISGAPSFTPPPIHLGQSIWK